MPDPFRLLNRRLTRMWRNFPCTRDIVGITRAGRSHKHENESDGGDDGTGTDT